jgi:adenosylhomocysteine nucleosidase
VAGARGGLRRPPEAAPRRRPWRPARRSGILPAMLRLGVVAPMPSEASCLTGRRHAPDEIVALEGEVLVCVGGVGPRRAARAAERLVERGAQALAVFGTAGGLDPGLVPGALLLPGGVLAPGGARFAVDAGWRARLAARLEAVSGAGPGDGPAGARDAPGTIVESARVLKTPEEKRALHAATGALAVDMESASVAAAAHAAGVPFLAVRAVSDTAAIRVPHATLAAVDVHGRLRLARAPARRPSDLAALARMHAAFRAAQKSLGRVARGAGTRLGLDEG